MALTGSSDVLLTPSCTAALERAALLLNVEPGDEVIMPSFTFVSTANAFVMRGAVPVFVDICPRTLNIDPDAFEQAITPRTRAVVVVHDAGVGADMARIMPLARHHGLQVIEDAAQGICASRGGQPLGSFGDLGALSFHDTKNVMCGEGGALLINRHELAQRAEILREKGTDRSRFLRGDVDRYTWQNFGSSYLPSELQAALLLAQLEAAADITQRCLQLWNRYHGLLLPLQHSGVLRRPEVPFDCEHNAHIYFVMLAPGIDRDGVLHDMRQSGVAATFHCVPLHSAPAGLRYGRAVGELQHTVQCAGQIVRLPLWVGMTAYDQTRVVSALQAAVGRQCVMQST